MNGGLDFIRYRDIGEADPEYDHMSLRMAHMILQNGWSPYQAREMLEKWNELMTASTILDSAKSIDSRDTRLTVGNLMTIARQSLRENRGNEYADRATNMVVLYDPSLSSDVVQTMSSFPWANVNGYLMRAMSVDDGWRMRTMGIKSRSLQMPMEKGSSGWVTTIYVPGEPVMEVRTSGRPVLYIGANNDTAAIEHGVKDILEIRTDAQDWMHEPNGPQTFPDFEAKWKGELWDVEVTRPLTGIVAGRIVKRYGPSEANEWARLAKAPPIDTEQLSQAVEHGIQSKAPKRSNRRYCLVFAESWAKSERVQTNYAGHNYESFDAVIRINLRTREAQNIKGDWVRT